MQRGALVTVVLSGDYGKPRPALIVQNNLFDALPSVVVCPLTSTLRADADLLRIEIAPSSDNGLRQISQIAVDKIATVPVSKVGEMIGQADDATMLRVGRALAILLGIV